LDSRAGWQEGGESGSAVVPGKPDESLLIKAVRYVDKERQMPPKDKGGKLGNADIAALVEWVQMGAPDPRVPEARTAGSPTGKAKRWWAFQPLLKPPMPSPGAGGGDAIDAFVNEKLAAAGLRKSPTADPRSLLRRATFDLTGLPPTPEETAAFLADNSPEAFERVVDRLL